MGCAAPGRPHAERPIPAGSRDRSPATLMAPGAPIRGKRLLYHRSGSNLGAELEGVPGRLPREWWQGSRRHAAPRVVPVVSRSCSGRTPIPGRGDSSATAWDGRAIVRLFLRRPSCASWPCAGHRGPRISPANSQLSTHDRLSGTHNPTGLLRRPTTAVSRGRTIQPALRAGRIQETDLLLHRHFITRVWWCRGGRPVRRGSGQCGTYARSRRGRHHPGRPIER